MDWAALPSPPDPVPPPARRTPSGAPLPAGRVPGSAAPARLPGPGLPEPRVAQLLRTLDQELVALLRGVSLECPVCGEFVMHVAHAVVCPECGVELRDEGTEPVGIPESALRLV